MLSLQPLGDELGLTGPAVWARSESYDMLGTPVYVSVYKKAFTELTEKIILINYYVTAIKCVEMKYISSLKICQR